MTQMTLDTAVEQEYERRLRSAIDEAMASAYQRDDLDVDEVPFTQIVTDAFEAANIKLMIRERLVALGRLESGELTDDEAAGGAIRVLRGGVDG